MKANERKCPRCSEIVKTDAKVCKHCRHEFSSEEIAAAKKQEQVNAVFGVGCLAIVILGAVAFCSFDGGTDPKEEAAIAAQDAEKRRKGFHCLSAWDGSHPGVVDQVKSQLRDPGSFEHAETRITPATAAGKHGLIMEYRARNGFGGMNAGSAVAEVNPQTCAAKLIETEDLNAPE